MQFMKGKCQINALSVIKENHICAVQEGEKPYKCSICDYSFAIKAKFEIHIDSVHDGKKAK